MKSFVPSSLMLTICNLETPYRRSSPLGRLWIVAHSRSSERDFRGFKRLCQVGTSNMVEYSRCLGTTKCSLNGAGLDPLFCLKASNRILYNIMPCFKPELRHLLIICIKKSIVCHFCSPPAKAGSEIHKLFDLNSVLCRK